MIYTTELFSSTAEPLCTFEAQHADENAALTAGRVLVDTYRCTVIVSRLEGSHGVYVKTRLAVIVNTDGVLL